METDYRSLPRTIDELGRAQVLRKDAESRQTEAWKRMMGAEEEWRQAHKAWLALNVTIRTRAREANSEYERAKSDAAAAKLLEDAAAFKVELMIGMKP